MSSLLDMGVVMAFEEKRAWIMIVTSVAGCATYLAVILGRVGDAPLASVPYAATMLWTIGGAIVATIVLQIIATTFSPRDADKKDERDREINRFGEYIGQSFVVIGGVAGLLLAMLKV